MKKKLLFIVPVVAMAMAGCAKNGGGSSSSTVDPTTSAQPTSGTVDPTTSGQPTTSGTSGETSGTTSTPTSGTTSETPTTTSSSTSETPTPVAVTGIKMNSSYNVNLKVGETSQIDAEVLPEDATDKGLVYSSSDETKATVSESGLITAVAAGNATITVAAHENPDIKKTISVVIVSEGFTYAQETVDGHALLKNAADLVNGQEIYLAGYVGEQAVILNGTAYSNKTSSNEEGKLVVESVGAKYTLVKSGDDYMFMQGAKYLASKGDSNGIQLVDAISDTAKFSIAIGENGDATIVAKSGSKNKLQVNPNNGSPLIRFYAENTSYSLPLLYAKTPVVLDHIEVTSEPTKTKYVEGEPFVKEGMTVKAVYSDGTETANVDYTVAEEGPLAAGTSEVHISYEGKEVTQAIEVHAKTLSSIVITSAPSKAYNIGDSVTKDDLVVKALYNVGDTGFEREDDNFKDYTISPESFTVPGDDVEVTIAAVADSSKTASFNVKVNDYELLDIEIKSNPTKLAYYDGDTLDPTGLVITAIYSGGEPKDIAYDASSFTLSPAAGSVLHADAEAQTVTVTYGGKTTSFDINVDELEVVSFSIKSNPTKTDYMVGETLDLTGLVVEATYNSGAKDSDFKGYTVNPAEGYEFTAGDIGTKAITVGIDGIGSETFSVNVEAKNGIKKAYEACAALEDGKTTSEEYVMDGTITGFVGISSGNYNSFLLQDGEYAMYVYKSTKTDFAIGDHVKVTSQLKKYNGMIETNTISSTVGKVEAAEGPAPVVAPVVVTSQAQLEALNQNVLVTLEKANLNEAMPSGDSHWKNKNIDAKAFDLETSGKAAVSFKKALFNQDASDVLDRMTVNEKVTLGNMYATNYKGAVQVGQTAAITADDSMNVRKVTEINVTPESPSITVLPGSNTVQLSAEVLPELATDKSVDWEVVETDDPAVAVDNTGLVTALHAGSAHVKAVAHDGSGVYGQTEVTVTAGHVAVTSVTLDKNELAVETNSEPITLTATVLPDDATTKDLTWTSSDESIATVANGVVSIKGAGEVTITATSVDDSSKSDACVITVTEHAFTGLVEEGQHYIGCDVEGTNSYYKGPRAATSNVMEATLFTFTLVDDNLYEITTGSDYLYGWDNSSGVSIGSTEDTWTIAEHNGHLSFKSTAGNRYLSLYSNHTEFRMYKETTQSGCVFELDALNEPEATKVVLSSNSEKVSIDGTTTVTAFLNGKAPTGSYSWEITSGSGNISISASGDSCEITGVAEGNATVKCSYGLLESATLNVEVKAGLVTYTLVSDFSTLTDGTEIMLVSYTSNTYKTYLGNLNSGHLKMEAIDSTKTTISGTSAGSTMTSTEASALTIKGSDGNWQITDGTNYLAFTGNSNGNDTFKDTNKDSDSAKFSFTSEGIISNKYNARGLRYNGSTGDLRNYAKAGQSVVYVFAHIA